MSQSSDLDILRSVFSKYDKTQSGSLNKDEFVKFLTRLSRYVFDLEGVRKETFEALFDLLSSEGELSFEDFCDWWLSSLKYKYFAPKTSQLLQKAHYLYKKHSSEKGMTYLQFNNLLDELQIEHTDFDFDFLDQNEDGLMGFSEFCKWLDWF